MLQVVRYIRLNTDEGTIYRHYYSICHTDLHTTIKEQKNVIGTGDANNTVFIHMYDTILYQSGNSIIYTNVMIKKIILFESICIHD